MRSPESSVSRPAVDAAFLRFARRAYAALDAGPALAEWADGFADAGASVVALVSRTGDEAQADVCVLCPTGERLSDRVAQQVSRQVPVHGSNAAPHVDVRLRSGGHHVGRGGESAECWGVVTIRTAPESGTGPVALLVAAPDDSSLKKAMRFAESLHDLCAATLDAVHRMRELATRDPMTGLFNRRGLDEQYPRIWNQCRRSAQSLSVIMLDMDSLKAINDAHGHAAGDQAILKLAEALKTSLRAQDLVVRYGGDEICIVLPATTPDAAWIASERLFRQIKACRLNPPHDGIGFSVSMGISGGVPGSDDDAPDRLWRESDQALREAKRGGGNQARIHGAQ